MTTVLKEVLNKRSFEAAEAYSKNNDIQVHYGKTLAITADIKRGDKILDMGCGTGELTSFLGEIVGREGQVVGVDPDFGRIQYAKQKHLSVNNNVLFEHGDSSTDFIQRNKSYYDVHFSNFVFQWLSPERKKEFVRVAFESLKRGGVIAIQSHQETPCVMKQVERLILNDQHFSFCKKDEVNTRPLPFFINKSETESILRDCGFEIISNDFYLETYRYATIRDFVNFVVASDYHDSEMLSLSAFKMFAELFGNDDGSVDCFDPTIYQIVAKKI